MSADSPTTGMKIHPQTRRLSREACKRLARLLIRKAEETTRTKEPARK